MTDLISRKAAIEAISKTAADYDDGIEWESGVVSGLEGAMELIKKLPSAEPERKVGTWTYRNGESLTGGVREGDIIYCSRCHKPTHVKIHTWVENGMKYGKAINVRKCPNCGARMVTE